MKLGLVCAAPELRQLAVGRLVASAEVELDWYVQDAALLVRQPVVACLLVAAAQCTPELLAAAARRGEPVLAIVRTLAQDCEDLYAALDRGVPGYLELATTDGASWPERLQHQLRRHVGRPAPLPPLIAIGASAGGPRALRDLLAGLPAGLPAAVLVVLHFEGERIDLLCEWLAQSTTLAVRPALAGCRPEAGCVQVADGGKHLELDERQVFRLASRQAADLHCPSVDRLFLSLAAVRPAGQAVLLTGMGQDGAQGLLALKQAGWRTLVQDAASSAVDGMPRAARELDAATDVLPLQHLAAQLSRAYARMAPA